MKLFQLFLCILMLLNLISCSFGTETQIHNQLNDTLQVEINDESYTILPDRLMEVSYTYGKNKIKSTYKNNVIIDTVVTITRAMTDKGALINATGKPYYIVTERYGNSILNNPVYKQTIVSDSTAQEKKYQNISERMKIVIIDSIPIIGDIETLPANQIIIPRDWYYDLDAKFEASIETNNINDSYFGKSVKKIFSEQELLQYWYAQQ